jgi:cytochrome P450
MDAANRMGAATVMPVRWTGTRALRWGWRFARDPLVTTRRIFEAAGPFVILAEGLPIIRPARAVMLGVPLVLTAGSQFHQELLSNPALWRGASLLPGGPRGSAARRMSAGLTRSTGDRHAHYRKLLLHPLHKTSVSAMAQKMARRAAAEAAAWPVDEIIDLSEYARRMMRDIALELLFGGRNQQSCAIADRVSGLMARKWDSSVIAFPINLSVTPYGRVVRDAEILERLILEWVAGKRGHIDESDLASIIVNSHDADGDQPDAAAIVGQLGSLLAAASEASHSVLLWTLLLLQQHPRVAAVLIDELRDNLGSPSPSLDKARELPYLDAVVKESMRVLPPVPLQIRVAQSNATISGHEVPKGTRVMLNTFLTNRMPDLYPDADSFQPERWFTIAPTVFQFPVFSGGPYSCPGYLFGSTAIKIALAAILTRCTIDVLPSTHIDYRVQPTLRPRHAIPVRLQLWDGGALKATPIAGTINDLVKLPN